VQIAFFYDKNRSSSLSSVKKCSALFPEAIHITAFDKLKSLEKTTLLVFGGDGTFHHVVNAISFSNTLALVPCGSGNDFVHNFKSVNVKMMIKAIGEKQISRIGLIKANHVYCLNAMGLFYDAKVAKVVSEGNKSAGKWAYTVAAIKHIFSYKPQSVLVNEVPQKLLMLSFGNGSYAGGGFNLFPDTNPSEFSFTRLQIGPINYLQRLVYLILVKFGKHHTLRNIDLSKSTHNSIKSLSDLEVEIDGEMYQFKNHLTIDYVPNCLDVIVLKV